jgi:hypothetical protein
MQDGIFSGLELKFNRNMQKKMGEEAGGRDCQPET